MRARGFDVVPRCAAAQHIPELLRLSTHSQRYFRSLAAHALLLGHTEDGRARRWWPTREGGRVRVSGRFITDDRRLLKAMALRGRGVALLSAHNCAEAIDSGQLAWVLPDTIGATLPLYVVYAQHDVLPPRVRLFVDAAIRHFSGSETASA